jgi:hypothetical protein
MDSDDGHGHASMSRITKVSSLSQPTNLFLWNRLLYMLSVTPYVYTFLLSRVIPASLKYLCHQVSRKQSKNGSPSKGNHIVVGLAMNDDLWDGPVI